MELILALVCCGKLAQSCLLPIWCLPLQLHGAHLGCISQWVVCPHFAYGAWPCHCPLAWAYLLSCLKVACLRWNYQNVICWGHAHFLKRACQKEACEALTCCCANVCGWLTHGHVAHNAQQLHGKMCLKDLCTQKKCVCTWPSGCNMWGLKHAEELHMLWMHVHNSGTQH